MAKSLWVSPIAVGSLEKPKRNDYKDVLDSTTLYGYEMQEGTALTIGAACLTADVAIIGVAIAT